MIERVLLGDVVSIIHGKNQREVESQDGVYPIYGSGGIMGRANDYLCPAHTVIVGRKGTINRPIYVDEPFWNVDTAFGLVADEDKLLPRYLFHFCSYFDFMKLNTAATIPSLTKKSIQGISCVLPPIPMQREACARLDFILSKIDDEQSMLESFDDLVKSRFVEMFGDPISNSKGLPEFAVEELAAPIKNAMKAGPFGSALKKSFYVETGYKIYGQEQVISGDQSYGDYYIDEAKYEELKSCSVKSGDVLISLVGTVGKVLILTDECEPGIINPRLVKITFDSEKILPEYFAAAFSLESVRALLLDGAHGQTMDVLNLGMIKKLRLPIPPIEQQISYLAFVQQVDKLKFETQQAIDKLQMLYDSLAQEYFAIE